MTPDDSETLRRDLVMQKAIADALVIECAQLKKRIAELERENDESQKQSAFAWTELSSFLFSLPEYEETLPGKGVPDTGLKHALRIIGALREKAKMFDQGYTDPFHHG